MHDTYKGERMTTIVTGSLWRELAPMPDLITTAKVGMIEVSVRQCTRNGEASGGIVISSRALDNFEHGSYQPFTRKLGPDWSMCQFHRAVARCYIDAKQARVLYRSRERAYQFFESMPMHFREQVEREASIDGIETIYCEMQEADLKYLAKYRRKQDG